MRTGGRRACERALRGALYTFGILSRSGLRPPQPRAARRSNKSIYEPKFCVAPIDVNRSLLSLFQHSGVRVVRLFRRCCARELVPYTYDNKSGLSFQLGGSQCYSATLAVAAFIRSEKTLVVPLHQELENHEAGRARTGEKCHSFS